MLFRSVSQSRYAEFVDQASQKAKEAAANPQPSPEQMKAQAEQQKTAGEIEKTKIEVASRQQEMKHETQMKGLDLQMKRLELNMKMIEAMKPEEEVNPETGEKTQKRNPALESFIAEMSKQNALLERVEGGIRRMNAKRTVQRDPATGRAIGIVTEDVPEEQPVSSNGSERIEDIVGRVEEMIGQRTAPRNIAPGAMNG